jgi:hypothetical protein
MDVYDHLDRTKILAELVSQTFYDPANFWQPAAFLFGPTDVVVKISGQAFSSEDRKDQLAVELVKLIVEEQTDAVVMLQEAWVAERDDPTDLSPAKTDPSRVDSLVVTVMRAHERTGSIAPIQREPNQPPRLGEWKDSGSEIDGRFVDPLVAALQVVWEGK